MAAVVGRGPGWGLVVAGTAAYLVCIGLVTIGYHVPRNEALAHAGPHGSRHGSRRGGPTWPTGPAG